MLQPPLAGFVGLRRKPRSYRAFFFEEKHPLVTTLGDEIPFGFYSCDIWDGKKTIPHCQLAVIPKENKVSRVIRAMMPRIQRGAACIAYRRCNSKEDFLPIKENALSKFGFKGIKFD